MTGGISDAGWEQLHDGMAEHVAAGELPGLVMLVARGDEVRVDAIGHAAFGGAPMARDAIFRIASLTKPVTAVTTMTLVEAGVLALDQPVDDLLPELAHRRVLRRLDAELDDTVPAARSVTVEDLLSSRLGFGSVMAPPDSLPIQRAEAAADLESIGGPPWPPVAHDVDSWIAALGGLPLMYQPGERWLYNTSSQVLGVLIARATGLDLPSAMRERVFEPLGMRDTGFVVPAAAQRRLTTAYEPDPQTGALSVLDDAADSWWTTPTSFPDGSGWLVSTIDDYWTFVSMMLAGGISGTTRILGRESVARMTTDRLTTAQRDASRLFLGDDGGWGLGFGVPAAGSDAPVPCGIGWEGGTGTAWRTDLRARLTGILFTQRAMTSPEPPPIFERFWAGVRGGT